MSINDISFVARHQQSPHSSLFDQSPVIASSYQSILRSSTSSLPPLLRSPTHSDGCGQTRLMGAMAIPHFYRQPTSDTYLRPYHSSTHRPSFRSANDRCIVSFPVAPRTHEHNYLSRHLSPVPWSRTSYDGPIYLHRRITEQFLQLMKEKIAQVRLFTMVTDSDAVIGKHSRLSPTSIMIQCHYPTHQSTVFVIDIRKLPATSSPFFSSIRNFCHFIFSPRHVIVSWGDVLAQLRPFAQLNLFDLSQITNALNLQKIFTDHWNSTHPHTSACLTRHVNPSPNSIDEDFLVCLVDTNDLEDEYHPLDTTSDFNTCLCPDHIRPYKAKNSLWSLCDALRFTFGLTDPMSNYHQVLPREVGTAPYSGFAHPNTSLRQTLVNRILSHIFASTRIFFHLYTNFPTFHTMTTSIDLDAILSVNPWKVSVVIILSDSHGKHFPPSFASPNYCLINRSISGLQWVHPYDPQLCARSIVQSPIFSSLLASAIAVIFLVGTNSVRSTSALQLMPQIQEIIELTRSNHSHLKSTRAISIVYPFQCLKPSTRFSTTHLLNSNIDSYTGSLADLASRAHISLIDSQVSIDQLHDDGMHLQPQYQSSLYSTLCQHISHIVSRHTLSLCTVRKRSIAAINRRNEQKNARLLAKRKQHTLIRPIHGSWLLKDTKQYLKNQRIHYARLPEIYRHQLRIQFNSVVDLNRANEALPMNAFNEERYIAWTSRTHDSKSL